MTRVALSSTCRGRESSGISSLIGSRRQTSPLRPRSMPTSRLRQSRWRARRKPRDEISSTPTVGPTASLPPATSIDREAISRGRRGCTCSSGCSSSCRPATPSATCSYSALGTTRRGTKESPNGISPTRYTSIQAEGCASTPAATGCLSTLGPRTARSLSTTIFPLDFRGVPRPRSKPSSDATRSSPRSPSPHGGPPPNSAA